jgi:phage head maturation protease
VENSISGWAIRYNEPTVIAGAFIERIAPAAFKGALGDVTLLWSHDHNRPLEDNQRLAHPAR